MLLGFSGIYARWLIFATMPLLRKFPHRSRMNLHFSSKDGYPGRMFSQERQRLILAVLADEGRVRVQALAARLNVSDDTVRRDLHTLAEQGVLHKTHGGAVALDVPRMARDIQGAHLAGGEDPDRARCGQNGSSFAKP